MKSGPMTPRNRRTWGKKYLITIAIPGYRPSIENVELSSPVQLNASLGQEPGGPPQWHVPFLDAALVAKPSRSLHKSKRVENRFGTEPTLIRKEDTTPH
ncbi:hypothetical protein TNCV_4599511 [Trichonephila clavipes]|nr:hypothetical protein TNCV_4599511 [Trichonephila clavipes]